MTLYPKPARLSIVAAALTVSSLAAGAQTFRGTLSGTVLDGSGAAVPNAVVQLQNPATNETLNGKSNGAGDFNFPELPVGNYKLTVSSPGFSTKVIAEIPV